MNRAEAQRILLLYRPGTRDAAEPEVAAALDLARRDPGLQRWLESHLALQQALQTGIRSLPVPSHLREAILAEGKVVRVPVWRRPALWVAAAAAVILFSGLASLLLQPRVPDRFEDFRARMVRTALRQYRMDITTNDMRQVRDFLAARGAPADYALPAGLSRLPLTGGGALKWRSQPVSMVCFDRGDRQMLFLFVLDRRAVPNAPPDRPEVVQVNKLVTASWSEGDKTYVLAGPDELDFARKYL